MATVYKVVREEINGPDSVVAAGSLLRCNGEPAPVYGFYPSMFSPALFVRDSGRLISMGNATADSLRLRALIDEHRPELNAALDEYYAINPRLFGSVARGDAGPESDIDILVDLAPVPADAPVGTPKSSLFRASGLSYMFNEILGIKVDLFPVELLKKHIAQNALTTAMPL